MSYGRRPEETYNPTSGSTGFASNTDPQQQQQQQSDIYGQDPSMQSGGMQQPSGMRPTGAQPGGMQQPSAMRPTGEQPGGGLQYPSGMQQSSGMQPGGGAGDQWGEDQGAFGQGPQYTSTQHEQGQPGIGEKIRGGMEKVAGKVAGKPGMVEKGQERQAGQFQGTQRMGPGTGQGTGQAGQMGGQGEGYGY